MPEHSYALVPLPGSERAPLADATPAGPLDTAGRAEVTLVLPRRAEIPAEIVEGPAVLTRDELAGQYGADPADVNLVRQTSALTMTVPEVRARAVDEFARTIAVISEALAKRTGRPADDLAVRTLAGAIIGVIMSNTMPWHGWSDDRQSFVDMFKRVDQALALLEAGLPL